jgi:hypothetical protein
VSVPVAAQVEPEEVEAFFEVDDARLVLVEDQTPRGQPARKLRLDLFGLLPGIAAGDQVVGVPHQDRSALHRGPRSGAGSAVADSGGLLQAVECHVHQQGTGHAPNALGNFEFDVTLSYRRLEWPRRVTDGA